MRVAEYLDREGIDAEELARRLGHKSSSRVSQELAREGDMLESWRRRLALEDEPIPVGREHEEAPQPPPGAPVFDAPPSPTAGLDLSAFAGYVEGAYKLGAYTIRDTEPLLAKAIEDHATQAGEAWAKWVESEPRVKALLERMMVGTPLGEVIAVHVGIGFSYFLARSAQARALADLQREQHAAGGPVEDEEKVEPAAAFAGA